jgi:hypothetical protein
MLWVPINIIFRDNVLILVNYEKGYFLIFEEKIGVAIGREDTTKMWHQITLLYTTRMSCQSHFPTFYR